MPLLGWGAGIRTPIGRSRVGSPTIERHPNFVGGMYDTLSLVGCQASFSILDGSPSTLASTLSQVWYCRDRSEWGGEVTPYKRLVCQCLGRFLITRNDTSSLEPIPVDGTNDEEYYQCEFKEWYVINEGNVGQS